MIDLYPKVEKGLLLKNDIDQIPGLKSYLEGDLE